jgi:hypothetical protein
MKNENHHQNHHLGGDFLSPKYPKWYIYISYIYDIKVGLGCNSLSGGRREKEQVSHSLTAEYNRDITSV